MIKKSVPVDELRLGMYVVELDRPWLGSGFAFQGFPLTETEQIDSLKRCCKIVFVDPERERWAPQARPSAETGACIYDEAVRLEDELPAAKEIYKSCEEALEQLQLRLRTDGEIEAEMLTSAVSSLTHSIQRNPDAILLLNSLKRRESYELARALDTSILMITFGRHLQFPTEKLELLGLAGMLLDVGMANLQDDIAAAAADGSTDPAAEFLKAHVGHSVDLIRSSSCLPSGIDEIVALHHERQDGTGYPRGLKAPEISIDGAVAAIVDAFSELTTPRPACEQLSASTALTRMHKHRGAWFHEALLEQFIQCIGVYAVGSVVELNTREVGIVIAQNLTRRLQPRVMVVLDEKHHPIHPQKILDLLKAPKTAGDEPYRIRRTLPKHALAIELEDFFL
jgi:HD-GYP domain-containing protein (c-di-GMP phosphodiesterase class II)